MASFTDAITQFNPYVAQLPVDAMVKVGMQKQAQYEQGVQKIQSQIDQVAGLDVLRNVDKNYLQTKLNELGNNLTTVAAGDFSNFQLVNSVGGMTKQLTKDPYIQAAVSSAANHRKQASEMEGDKKKGTLTPDNEAYYNKQLSSYLNSEDIKDKDGNPIVYSGKYIPNFDVFKFAKETFDAIKPDGMSFDQVYVTDGNGNPKVDAKGQPIYSPTMIRMEQEGIFPAKVKETLGQIFSDPRVAQQLSITGQYNYRGLTDDQLSGKILDQKENVMAGYQNQLNNLNLQKNAGKDVQKDIDAVTQQMNASASSYDDYAKVAFENPDGVKGQLYKDDVNARYTTMFGWIKKKELTMENPGWNANFKLMEEANQQSRFAQELHQRKLEHADAMKWKEAEFMQKERLEGKKKGAGGTGDGTGPGGGAPEQADQPSDIDVVHKLEQDYDKAATNFRNSSDEFIWGSVLSGAGNNEAELEKLQRSGKSRAEAMSFLIDNAAKYSNQSPEEFRATWGEKAVIAYNRLTPKERSQKTSMTDAYNMYNSAKRNFSGMATIKKRIDDATVQQLGPNGVSQTTLLENVPAQQIVNFRGKNVTLSKEDLYDMAVYLRGNKSSLGFLNDNGSRTAGAQAYKRLEARGTSAIADHMLSKQGSNLGYLISPVTGSMLSNVSGGSGGPFTGTVRTLKNVWNNVFHSNDFKNLSYVDKQVIGLYSKIDNDQYEKGLKIKSDIIKSAYGIQPNLKVGLTSGDVPTDKVTFSKIKNWAGAYSSGQKQNLSSDFSKFASSLGDNLEKSNVEAQVIMDANNNPQIELVSYDKDGDRVGGMTIQPDEAANIGIDVNALYESKDVSILRHTINNNYNKTSAGDVSKVATYIQNDVYFNRNDFPNMQNAPFDVKANIVYRNGIYYPYLYASDGTRETVRELPGSDNLQQVVLGLKKVDPTFTQAILINR